MITKGLWKRPDERWGSGHPAASWSDPLRYGFASGAAVITIEALVSILDWGGTFVFAISGVVAAVNRRLDIFGILVVSFVTGNLGGSPGMY